METKGVFGRRFRLVLLLFYVEIGGVVSVLVGWFQKMVSFLDIAPFVPNRTPQHKYKLSQS
jgi:hypothetical protein